MLQLAARTLSLDRILFEEGLSFGIVRHSRQIQTEFIGSVDALIIQPTTSMEPGSILGELRNMPDPEDYLLPVFAIDTPKLRHQLSNEVDGFTKLDDLSGLVDVVRSIQNKIEKLPAQQSLQQGFDTEVLNKIMQYCWTRQSSLKPRPDRFSKMHYRYPFASFLLDESTEHRLLDIFRLAEKKGYFAGELVDRIHLCPTCSSAHHNLRATCTKCKSVDILEEDLVHHFPCATISPISDFKKGGHDGLHCPKCNKSLRHIGNDYDKPSTIHNCNQCHHTFQQAAFRSLCIDCGSDIELHRLEEAEIRHYQLTTKGIAAVKDGTLRHAESQKPEANEFPHGVYPWNAFKALVKQEASKKGRPVDKGVLGQVKVGNLVLEAMAPAQQQALSLEICHIIKSYLKQSDAVSSKELTAYYFLLPHQNLLQAIALKEVLEYNLQQLLISNLKQKTATVKIALEKLSNRP